MIRRLCMARRGSAAVEFALMAPVIAVILVGVADWGIAIEQRERLQTAARAGAQIALSRPTETTAIEAAVNSAAGSLTGLNVSSSGIFCSCDGTAMGTCTDSCAGTIATYVTVGVSRPYSRISPTGPSTISANVTVRVN
jgi:Flp pilus assembly protein TadG